MGTQREDTTKKEMGSQMQLFVYRNPKKNHDAMVKLQKEFKDLFRKLGDSPRYEVFHLDDTDTQMEGITNIVNTVSANQDEEVWVEIMSYKDRKHMDEYCEKCKNDESMGGLYQKFMNLVTPGTGLIMGDFSRIKV
jgi:uncharacterized protein YbaA (DUF1428 family)